MIKRICGNCWYWNPKNPETAKCKACDTNRKNFFPREMVCNVCDEPMRLIRHEFFECKYCGTETHPFFRKISDKAAIQDEFEKQLPCARNHEKSSGIMHVKSKASSGSKSKGGSKKQLMQKPSTTQIYKDLSNKPNKIKLRKTENT